MIRIVCTVPNSKVGDVLEALEKQGINDVSYHIIDVIKTPATQPGKRKAKQKVKRAARTLGDTRKSSSKAVRAVAKYMAKHREAQTPAVSKVISKMGMTPSYAATILHTMCKEGRCRKVAPGSYQWIEELNGLRNRKSPSTQQRVHAAEV